MNDMARSFASEALRLVVAAKALDYSRIDDPGLRDDVHRMVMENAGRSNSEIASIVRSKLNVNLRSDWVDHIKSRSAADAKDYGSMSGDQREKLEKKIIDAWSKSERFEKFEDISAEIRSKERVSITPKEVSRVVSRFVQQKMGEIPGGLSMVDFVGKLVLDGKGHDQIVKESDGAVPKHRIAEIWKYFKRLHPEVAEDVHFGTDMSFARELGQTKDADLIGRMYDQGVPVDKIAAGVGISQADVWKHLIGAASGERKIRLRTLADLDAAARDYAGRLPIIWQGQEPRVQDLAKVEGSRPSSGWRRFRRFQRQVEERPSRRSRPRSDFEAGQGLVPELVDKGLSDWQISDQLTSLMFPHEEDWSPDNVRYIRENFPPVQPATKRVMPQMMPQVMPQMVPQMAAAAFARPSDRFVRLSQLNPGPAAGAAAGVAPAGAAGTAVNTQQVQQQQQVDRNKQITDLKLSVDRLRKAISTAEASLAGQRMELQKQTANLVALQQQR